MQEQAELRESKPKQAEGQDKRGKVDPSGQGFDNPIHLAAPVRDLLIIILQNQIKILQILFSFAEVTTQQI